MANPLDNPVWHTLRGPRTDLAEQVRGGTALRFSSEISIFAAVEHFDDDAWAAQAELVGPGGVVFLFRDQVPAPPEGWTELMRIPTLQLVAGDLAPAPDAAIVTLGDADVEEMLALTKLTEPGPFLPRTHELGTYVGVKQAGRLVAMAGERFQMPGWTEISAVCTHPDARRQGLGAALSLRVAQNIRKRGDEAFLHVIETNESALLLYESIGFRIRRMMDVVALQWGDAPA